MELEVPWAWALGLAGPLVEVETEVERRYRRAVELGRREVHAGCAALLGRTALSRGRPHRAIHFLREALAGAPAFDQTELRPRYLAALAQAAALAGNLRLAEKALGEADALGDGGSSANRVELGLAHAWILALQGQLSRAASIVLASADDAEAGGLPGLAAFSCHEAVRLGAPAAAERLTAAAGDNEALLMHAFAAHAKAVRASDADALGAVAAAFEDFGAGLLAAEAWSEAATAHRLRGHPERGLAAIAGADRCLDGCEGARTPALTPQTMLARTLTPRQRDVALLVAGGLSNRQVAERLYVSLRTVENHLYQVYAKLAVSGRKDLARWVSQAA